MESLWIKVGHRLKDWVENQQVVFVLLSANTADKAKGGLVHLGRYPPLKGSRFLCGLGCARPLLPQVNWQALIWLHHSKGKVRGLSPVTAIYTEDFYL